LATVQYKAGLSDFLAVLDAQREMYANQDLLAQSRTQVTTNLMDFTGRSVEVGRFLLESSPQTVNRGDPECPTADRAEVEGFVGFEYRLLLHFQRIIKGRPFLR